MAAKSETAVPRNADSYLHNNVFDLFSLKDRVVIITGGARGIGLALGFAVAEAGGSVAIIDAAPQPHEHYKKLQEICKAEFYQADVTDYEKLQATFDKIVEDFGRIDGLITAAGVCPDQAFLDRDPKDVERTFKINVFGTYFATQLAARQMVKQGRRSAAPTSGAGSVVHIASVSAHEAPKLQLTSDYSSSKGAVLGLTHQLGSELASMGVRVNSISPGYILTDMSMALLEQRKDVGEVFVNAPAMKRMGDRTDLKGAAVYLLSDASAYMTGSEMLITGGLHVT
ncbi:putative short-chain dehydrogenase [Eremomyces bilateralis CBS 781.70]|uniref:Short-chain dehydrogenase n=1 Tax=Eremomyces bilateralis CBS 781.70 TaxID=1392243 RepID=A0A6G1GGH6_9PEZI|nr:putative short-chain dehydrogenase [Eremomyces bilateralis CBS 781.70]KAF1817168.1 putative short-chain dehydrogenase [Eremomyces bilateralis CBS 781.70]